MNIVRAGDDYEPQQVSRWRLRELLQHEKDNAALREQLQRDEERFLVIEEALRTPELKSDGSRLAAIDGIVQSRKPPTPDDIEKTKELAQRFGWERKP